jgi:hypothetical protein
LLDREAADRGVEKLDHVKGGKCALPPASQAAHQLEEASRIRRDNGMRACVEKVANFAIAQLLGRLRLEEVIDAGRATAQRGLGYLGDF